MSVQQQKFKEIADAIREKTGSTDLIKPSEFAGKIGEVYEAGKQSGISADIYDVALASGKRTNCEYTFSCWSVEYIRPDFVFKPNTGTIYCFSRNAILKKIEKQYFDFSGAPENRTGSSGHYYTCFNCTKLEVFEDIGFQASDYTNTWHNCLKLHTIELVRSNKVTKHSSAYLYCYELVNIRFEGEIGQNISFLYSPLSVESMIDVILHLVDYTGTADEYTKTLTFKSDCWDILDAEGATAPGGITWRNYIGNLRWLTA